MSFYDPVDTLAAPALLTPWSATHAALGVLLVSVGMYLSDNRAVVFAVAFALHALYELLVIVGRRDMILDAYYYRKRSLVNITSFD